MDKILCEFFSPARWQAAIERGVGKGIRKVELLRMCDTEFRLSLCQQVQAGKYQIAPPHTVQIPKDAPGEFRTVYVNEPLDRVFLSVANDLLFDLMPHMVHPACRSYLRGTGCGDVVREVSRQVVQSQGECVGWKSDLSKYFDTVPIGYIDRAFDQVEAMHGHSAIIDVLRRYYHSDLYFDQHGHLCHAYQSLKQGCSVAAWLADVILYHIDEQLASMDGYYVRYSDDMLFLGHDMDKAMGVLRDELAKMQMTLNPRKVEHITKHHWFKFLGFSIRGADISLSGTRIKTFQREIQARTTKRRGQSYGRALASVNRFLYQGDGEHSWATQVLPVCNVRRDIDLLNQFAMDALRAVLTGRGHIGGLGYAAEGKEGCVERGTGRNVTTNRQRTSPVLDGYLTLGCMQNALHTSRAAYQALVDTL